MSGCARGGVSECVSECVSEWVPRICVTYPRASERAWAPARESK